MNPCSACSDEIVPVFARTGFVRERLGPDTVNVVPHSHYQTADGKWIALACTSDKMFDRLAQAMGREDLSTDPRFATMAARIAHRDEVNALVAAWIGAMTLEQTLAACDRNDVPCGPIYSISDIFKDPQYRARGNIVEVDSRAGRSQSPALSRGCRGRLRNSGTQARRLARTPMRSSPQWRTYRHPCSLRCARIA